MFPYHYTVPENLNIRLIGYVRWGENESGHNVTVLWRDTTGRDYFYEDVWNPYSLPFWMEHDMEDLIPCTPDTFASHAEQIYLSVEDPDESLSVYYRYRELMTVWGYAEGVEAGFAWLANQPEE